MKVSRFLRICAVAVLTLPGILMAQSKSSDLRTLIEQALNEPVPITLEDTTLGEAIQQLAEQTGIDIVMRPEVMNLAPHGAETPVQKVNIPHKSVREGLTAIFSRLGMTFIVRGDHVEIVPTEALYGLGRTPTWVELDTLAALAATHLGTDMQALAKLESGVQFQVDRPDSWRLLSEAMRRVGAGPGDEVLTIACGELGWAWTLSGEQITITSMGDEIRRRLQQPISLRTQERPLFEVMQVLADHINVDIHADPGALASLPEHLQHGFSLTVYDKPGEEVLDTIAGYTGLGYLIEPDGVLFYNPRTDRPRTAVEDARPQAAGASDPYVASLAISLDDGTSIRWLIRLSELPEDLRQMRERDLQKAFDAVRRHESASKP